METFKLNNLNDFLPFLKLTISQLKYIQQIILKENIFIPEGNRVYYMSNKLMVKKWFLQSHDKFINKLFLFLD